MSGDRFEVRLSREMRLVDVMMIGVGAMIGAGIFVLTGIAAGVAGPALILAFLLNGAVSLLTAMAYAELGSCFHDAGGGYLWVKKGLPDPNGFLSGWMSWFAHAVACSLYALGFGAYFALVVRMLGYEGTHVGPFPLEKTLACGVVVLFGFINYRGASETGKAGNIVTTAKILVLGVFIAFGMAAMWRNPGWTANFSDFMPNGAGGVFMAMGLTFIAFEGYEIIAQCSEEVRDPRNSIPRAVFLSMLIVVPIYLLVAWVAIGAIDGGGLPTWKYLAEMKETAMVEAARQFFTGGGLMILVGGILSTMSALNATIYSSSRVSFAMARDHNLPSMFAKLSRVQRTPHVAILFSMGIIIAALLWLPIEDVASAADVMFLLLFLQVNVALIRLRRRMPHLDRGFKVPFFPVLPLLAIAGNLFIAGWLFVYSPKAWITVALWIGGGAVLHRYYAGPKEEAALEHAAAVERMERKEYRVLVALSSSRTAPALMRVGMAIARRHGGEVVCLGVLEVPEDEPLIAGVPHTGGLDPLVSDGVRMAREAGLDARGLIKVSHRVSHGIVETAREEDCNFIVMGRRARPAFLEWLFAATVDTVLREAPCDVALVGLTPVPGDVRRVRVAVGQGGSARLAAELAPALAAWYGAEIRPVLVVPPMAGERAVGEAATAAAEILRGAEITGAPAVIRHEDVVEGILMSSAPGDLIVLGGPAPGALGQLLTRPVSLELLDRGPLPTIMVRRHAEQRAGWLERTLGLS
jgi:amino acid transporter/nucleotide-binding universal stress UspA family protein